MLFCHPDVRMLLSRGRCCKHGGNKGEVVENTWRPYRRISERKQMQKKQKIQFHIFLPYNFSFNFSAPIPLGYYM